MSRVAVRSAYVVHCFADLWFGLVLEVGPLGPEEGDGASGLWRETYHHPAFMNSTHI